MKPISAECQCSGLKDLQESIRAPQEGRLNKKLENNVGE